MAASPETAGSLHERANRLYWNSNDTVDQVASRIGISRSALYGAIEPQPAGASCPECGTALVFTNRTNRAAGQATCTECETAVDLESVRQHSASPSEMPRARRAEEPFEGGIPAPQGRMGRWREDLSNVEPQRAAWIGGAAALGVMLGAAATALLRERI